MREFFGKILPVKRNPMENNVVQFEDNAKKKSPLEFKKEADKNDEDIDQLRVEYELLRVLPSVDNKNEEYARLVNFVKFKEKAEVALLDTRMLIIESDSKNMSVYTSRVPKLLENEQVLMNMLKAEDIKILEDTKKLAA